MEWNDAKPKLTELARRAGDGGGDANRLLSESIETLTEQLDHLHKHTTHLSERLHELSSRIAGLEARLHEDVE